MLCKVSLDHVKSYASSVYLSIEGANPSSSQVTCQSSLCRLGALGISMAARAVSCTKDASDIFEKDCSHVRIQNRQRK